MNKIQLDANALITFMDEVAQPDPKDCKGQVFRCNISSWIGSDGSVNFRQQYRFLKRKSCPGCENCGWMHDDLNERMSDSYMRDTVMQNGIDGKLYTLQVTNISRDWESGIVDDYDLEFVEYKEKKDE